MESVVGIPMVRHVRLLDIVYDVGVGEEERHTHTHTLVNLDLEYILSS